MSKKKRKPRPWSTGEARIVSPDPGDVQLENGLAEVRVWVKPVTGFDATAFVRIIRGTAGPEVELEQHDGDVCFDGVSTGTGTFRIRARAQYTEVADPGNVVSSDNDEWGDYNGIAFRRKASQPPRRRSAGRSGVRRRK